MPLSFLPKKAEAQSVSGYISGVSSAILTLPQCENVISGGINGLFLGSDASFYDSLKKDIPAIEATLGTEVTEAINEFDSIKTSNSTLEKDTKEVLEKVNKIDESTASLNENSTCIQSIGRLIIKMLLQKLTVSTVNWINSGFDGSPAFVQNPGKFFNDIAKNEILQFGLEINNPELFPFGKVWMQNTATAFNKKFQDNARYSLNELIKDTTPEYSAETFQQDFSQGGWNAWTAMTQVPANNPIGFKLMADNEIQRRLAGTTQSTAEAVHEALSQANGFLGDMRCSADANITQAQRTNALAAGKGDPCIEAGGSWEYVTPGKMISDAATNVIGYQNNAYLNVEDLNDAVAAILDALLGQFSSSIMEKGFANIGNEGSDGTLIYDASISNDPYRTQTEKDFLPTQLSSSWLKANPNFNIRTDLTQALIDEQRTYSDKLAMQNKELLSTTDGKKYKLNETTGESNAYGLIPLIHQIDYCIPGPHSGWESDAQKTLNGIIIPGVNSSGSGGISTQDVAVTAVSTAASFIPIVGGFVGGILSSIFGSDDDTGTLTYPARKYYTELFKSMTGFGARVRNSIDDDKDGISKITATENNVSSNSAMAQVLNRVLDRYIEIMNKTYFSSGDMLPSTAKELAANYNQLTGYKQMLKNNEDKIISFKTTVNILGEIKDSVDSLNNQLKTNQITEEKYEEDLKTQINAFGRLSASMVNGDDIAKVDNLYKQIVDKKEYLYKNFLKGQYGCEAFLANPANIKNFPSAGESVVEVKIPEPLSRGAGLDWSNYNILSVKRVTYPKEILYDYNHFKNGELLPDPWKKQGDVGYNNYMSNIEGTNILGPGFLSFVFFSSDARHPRELKNKLNGPERLIIDDLLDTTCGAATIDIPGRCNNPEEDAIAVPLGKFAPDDRIRFEDTIGIY